MAGKCVLFLSVLVLGHTMALILPVNRDKMYLPDQVDYLKVWSAICETDNLIYWPQDGQCYPESSRGPCFVQEVLLLDRQRLVPHCAPEPAEPQESASQPTPTPALSQVQEVLPLDGQKLAPICAPELPGPQESAPQPTPTLALSQGL